MSTDATWLGVAFLADQRHAAHPRAAAAGSVAMSVANATYYAWIAATERGTALADVAGPPAYRFALGVLGGAAVAVSGSAWARSTGALRVAASLPLSCVCIADGVGRWESASGAATAALGVAFPIISASDGRERLVAGLLSTATVTIALTGRLDPLLP